MCVYSAVSYFRLRKRISEAVLYRDNIYISERISTPFIFGMLRPRIYLPCSGKRSDEEYIIAHETTHLKRLDHMTKPLAFFIACIHWFNPLVWIGYVLFCRDIELACDERVIKEYDREKRAEYANALISCSTRQSVLVSAPLLFGESPVGTRVKSILKYKKPALLVTAVCVAAAAVVAVLVFINPVPAENSSQPTQFSDMQDQAVKAKNESSTQPQSAAEPSEQESEEETLTGFDLLLKKMTPTLPSAVESDTEYTESTKMLKETLYDSTYNILFANLSEAEMEEEYRRIENAYNNYKYIDSNTRSYRVKQLEDEIKSQSKSAQFYENGLNRTYAQKSDGWLMKFRLSFPHSSLIQRRHILSRYLVDDAGMEIYDYAVMAGDVDPDAPKLSVKDVEKIIENHKKDEYHALNTPYIDRNLNNRRYSAEHLSEEIRKIQKYPDFFNGRYVYWLDSDMLFDRREIITVLSNPNEDSPAHSDITITYQKFDYDGNVIEEEVMYSLTEELEKLGL